jgi:hypothetical protein
MLYGSEGIELFQFHQSSLSKMTVWIVPTGEKASARQRVLDSVRQKLDELSSGALEVDIREVDSIPLSPAGKHRFTRSDVTIPTSA